MKLLKMQTPPIKATVIALMASVAFGDIYVAVNDPHAGDTAVEGRGTEDLPYKTLQAAMEHGGGLASGTTVWVKPGTYAEGGAFGNYSSNRVVVPAGVIVRATGTAEETIIKGKLDPDTKNDTTMKGIGPKALRCVALESGSVLRGFTLTDGRSSAVTGMAGYGGASYAAGTFIDCVFTGNRAWRGGAFAGSGNAIRCLFKADNTATLTGQMAINGKFFNCIMLCSTASYDLYQEQLVVNCTFYGKDTENGVQTLYGDIYNSLFVGAGLTDPQSKRLHNTLVGSTKNQIAAANYVDGSFTTNTAAFFPLNARYAPTKANLAVGHCTDYDAYVALFPVALREEAAYDFYGNPRKGGGETVFDVGAVERDDVRDPEDWYVDDENGSDDYTGADKGFAEHPFKSIQAAMDDERVMAAHVIHVKPGTYAGAATIVGTATVTSNRVVMKKGVRLESTDGPAKTIIEGGEGCRCVVMDTGCVLKGFTLQNGHPDMSEPSEENRNGGCIYGTGEAVIDCIIRNGAAYRGGGNSGKSAFFRCQFLDNTCTYTGSAGYDGAKYYNCLIRGGGSYALYVPLDVVNCTFVGEGTSENCGSVLGKKVNNLYLIPFQDCGKSVYTNCCFGYNGTKPPAGQCDGRCQSASDPLVFPILRNYALARHNPGVNACTNYAEYAALFPAKYRDEAALDLYGRPRVKAGSAAFDVGCVERNPDFDFEDWYVDAEKGDDSYEGEDKGSLAHPYKTLQAAMENPRLLAGETVNALPGVYREGGAVDENGHSNRVVVAKGVWLESTGGSDVTAIEGAPSPGKAVGTTGVGANAMRCVKVNSYGAIRGFTLRNGHCRNSDDLNLCGGGIHAGTAYDCVISNCYARRGAAMASAALIRCKIFNCQATSISILYQGSLYDCLIGKQATVGTTTYVCSTIRNCTFLKGAGNPVVHYNDANPTYVENSVFLCQPDNSANYTHCAFSTDVTISDANLGTGSFRASADELGVNEDGSLQASSLLIDKGSDDLYPLSKAGEWDCLGNRRFLGSSIDIGCAEYDSKPPQLMIADPLKLLLVTGAKAGENRIRFGQPITFTIARPANCRLRNVRGFTVNGEYVSFADHEEGWRYTGTVEGEDSRIEVVADYPEHGEWFIDPVKGDDANLGYTRETAFKTFHGAFTNAFLAAGDTVFALPGEYATGSFSDGGTKKTVNRVTVPAGVKLVSTDGPAVTVIRGARAPEEGVVQGKGDYTKYGLGTNSVRTVKLGEGSELRGFTIADGTAWGLDSSGGNFESGGNISAPASAFIVDCVITNGVAPRGGGVDGGSYVRCRFTGNRAISLGSSLYQAVNLYGCVVEKGLGGGYCWYQPASSKAFFKVVNSIFTADNGAYVTSVRDNGDGLVHFYNTIDLCKPQQGVHYHAGCITVGKVSTSVVDPGVVVTNAAAVGIGEGGVPARDSLATDTGVYEDFATNWPSAYGGEALKDLVGTERILNRTIDVGAVEYDWKKDFAAALTGKPKFAVTAATTNVVLGADGGVVLSDGERMSAAWGVREKVADIDYGFTVTVTGTGTLTYAVDGGEPVAVPAGTQTIALKGTNAAKTFDFAFTGDGSATLTSFTRRSNVGALLIVR